MDEPQLKEAPPADQSCPEAPELTPFISDAISLGMCHYYHQVEHALSLTLNNIRKLPAENPPSSGCFLALVSAFGSSGSRLSVIDKTGLEREDADIAEQVPDSSIINKHLKVGLLGSRLIEAGDHFSSEACDRSNHPSGYPSIKLLKQSGDQNIDKIINLRDQNSVEGEYCR